MDATTILATICCAIVFCGWLVLPHSALRRKETMVKEREAARLSA